MLTRDVRVRPARAAARVVVGPRRPRRHRRARRRVGRGLDRPLGTHASSSRRPASRPTPRCAACSAPRTRRASTRRARARTARGRRNVRRAPARRRARARLRARRSGRPRTSRRSRTRRPAGPGSAAASQLPVVPSRPRHVPPSAPAVSTTSRGCGSSVAGSSASPGSLALATSTSSSIERRAQRVGRARRGDDDARAPRVARGRRVAAGQVDGVELGAAVPRQRVRAVRDDARVEHRDRALVRVVEIGPAAPRAVAGAARGVDLDAACRAARRPPARRARRRRAPSAAATTPPAAPSAPPRPRRRRPRARRSHARGRSRRAAGAARRPRT